MGTVTFLIIEGRNAHRTAWESFGTPTQSRGFARGQRDLAQRTYLYTRIRRIHVARKKNGEKLDLSTLLSQATPTDTPARTWTRTPNPEIAALVVKLGKLKEGKSLALPVPVGNLRVNLLRRLSTALAGSPSRISYRSDAESIYLSLKEVK